MNQTSTPQATYSPQERAILARFARRTRCAARHTAEMLSHGAFVAL
jgi:hypothetical protein